jgi:hypothetical protein
VKLVVATLALLAAVAVCVSSCSSGKASDSAVLHALGDEQVWAAQPNTRPGPSYVFPLRPLCTSGGAITIDKVIAASPSGGMRVASWGVRADTGDTNYSNAVPLFGPVERWKGFGHRPVHVRCGDQHSVEEFAVSVSRTSPELGRMQGLWIEYGRGKKLYVQNRVVICGATDCGDQS